MSTATRATASALAGAESETARSRRRRARLGWLATAAAILVVAIVLIILRAGTAWDPASAYDPESHGPEGFRAVAEVLREQGVTVTTTHTLGETEAALRSGATLAMTDAPGLSDEALRTLWSTASTVVLLAPTSRVLALSMDAAPAGFPASAAAPSCAFPPVQQVTSVVINRTFTGGDEGCFPDGDGGYGLVTAERDGVRLIALDGTTLFTNADVLENDNAALALGLLGQSDHLVWYRPSPDETDQEQAPTTLADLTPKWVTPAIVLLIITAAGAGLVAGRRFGPLVRERLPVTVRAAETMEGRARLYAKGRDAAHASAVLRRSTANRVGTALGMGPRSAPEAIADAAAAALAVDPGAVKHLLLGPPAHTDTELVALSDQLARLQAAVIAAVRTERTTP